MIGKSTAVYANGEPSVHIYIRLLSTKMMFHSPMLSALCRVLRHHTLCLALSSRLDPDESIGLGLGMALCANIVTTLGLNLQRYAHTKSEPGVPYTGSRLWWTGVCLMILGEIGNFTGESSRRRRCGR